MTAEEAGEMWPHWARLREFLIPLDSVESNYAVASISPVVCAAKRVGDTLFVAVQFGELGTVVENLDDGHWSLVPRVRWVTQQHLLVQEQGAWRLHYRSDLEPRIGVKAAIKGFQGTDPTQFRSDLAEAAAALHREPRPTCPS